MKGVRRGWSECLERTSQSIVITSIDRSLDHHHSDGEHQAVPICRKRARTLTSASGKRFCQVSQDESCLSTEWNEEKRGLEKAASAEILEKFGDATIRSTSRSRNPALNDEPLSVKRKIFSESRRKKVLQRIQRPNSALSLVSTPIKATENVMIQPSSAKENLHLMSRSPEEMLTKANPQPSDLPSPSISRRFSRSNLKKRSDSMGNEEPDQGIRVKQCRRERRNSSAPPVQNRLMRRRNAMYLPVKKLTSSDELTEELFCDSSDQEQIIIKNHCSFDEYRHPSMKFEWGIDGDEEKNEEEREIDEEMIEITCRDGKEVKSSVNRSFNFSKSCVLCAQNVNTLDLVYCITLVNQEKSKLRWLCASIRASLLALIGIDPTHRFWDTDLGN